MTQPTCDSIAATSAFQASATPSAEAIAETDWRTRMARPNASGLASEQHLRKSLDASVECLLQQDALGDDQAILIRRRLQCHRQNDRWTGLGKEAEYLSLVYRGDRVCEIELPGEQNTHRVGSCCSCLPQHGHSVHPGHPKIGHDHRERTIAPKRLERRCTAVRGSDVEIVP